MILVYFAVDLVRADGDLGATVKLPVLLDDACHLFGMLRSSWSLRKWRRSRAHGSCLGAARSIPSRQLHFYFDDDTITVNLQFRT